MSIRPISLIPQLSHCAYLYIGIMSCICLRLFYLQIIRGSHFAQQSTHNFLRTEKIKPHRGNILDCNGILLATNRPVVNVYWSGTGNKKLSPEQEELCITLCALADQDYAQEKKYISSCERTKNSRLLVADIPFGQLCQLKELYGKHPNIRLETTYKRFYPHKSHASHIIGYLGNRTQEVQGIMGLEKLEQEQLRGSDGIIQKTVNSVGTPLEQKKIEPELDGAHIYTTLDIELQKIAERVFPPEHKGTLLIVNPHDGSIRALVSRPGFDPNIFLDAISTGQWDVLQQNQPFLNRATQACYAVGSIFKLITISAALENHLIDINSTWNCTGYFYYRNRKYWCNNHFGHGTVTIPETIAHSCNIPFFDFGTHVDIDLLASYAHRFGLGTKTGVMLPEKEGIVPSRAWKYERYGEPWWQGETLSITIGQGYLGVTPIQVACLIGSIFTGSLVRPRILVSEAVEAKPLAIEYKTRQFLIEAMKLVVEQGTGRALRIKDINVHAKTSTAQVSSLSKRKQDATCLEHGWVAAHVTYKDHEPFVMIIVVEHAGSAQVAITVGRNFLIQYKKQMNATS